MSSDKYPYLFVFATTRPMCSKPGCKNEAQYFTWMGQTKTFLDAPYHAVITACNIHAPELSNLIDRKVKEGIINHKRGGEESGKGI